MYAGSKEGWKVTHLLFADDSSGGNLSKKIQMQVTGFDEEFK